MSRRHLAAALVLFALVGAGCEGEPIDSPFPGRSPIGRPTSSESLVIGLVGTLSGPDSWRGEDAFEGADLAIHELNASRPADAMPIELISLDDEGDPAKALTRIEEIAGLERSIGLIYAGPSGVLPEAEEVLATRGIPAITLFSDLYGAEEMTEHTFQAGPSKVWEARRLAAYLDSDRGYRKVGVLAPNTDEGSVAIDAIETEMPSRTRVVDVTYASQETLSSGLERLRREHVEAVIFDGSPSAFRTAIEAITEMGGLYEGTDSARIASARPRDRARSHRHRLVAPAAGGVRWSHQSPSWAGGSPGNGGLGYVRARSSLPPGPEFQVIPHRIRGVVGPGAVRVGAAFLRRGEADRVGGGSRRARRRPRPRDGEDRWASVRRSRHNPRSGRSHAGRSISRRALGGSGRIVRGQRARPTSGGSPLGAPGPWVLDQRQGDRRGPVGLVGPVPQPTPGWSAPAGQPPVEVRGLNPPVRSLVVGARGPRN